MTEQQTTLRDDDTVTITHEGTVDVSLRAASNSASASTHEDVDQYRLEWHVGPDGDERAIFPDEIAHYRSIGCPTCKMNTRAVFRGFPDDPHYECLVCGYRNSFDPERLASLRRAGAEVVDQ